MFEALPRLLEPADRYEASVKRSSADASHFDRVTIKGHRIARPSAPKIEELFVVLSGVTIDRVQKRIVSTGHATGVVALLADDLSAYLAEEPRLDHPHVRLNSPDQFAVDAGIKLPDALGARPIGFGVEGWTPDPCLAPNP